MNIEVKLNKDFERALDAMKEKYGEDFEKLNGFHESNLNYSDFVDGFIDRNNKKALADTTIDGNANATTRDITSLLNERGKPEDKMFVFNKIFYELKKKYGLKTAKEWLEAEWTGAFYMHDAHTASFKPYSYKGSETIVVYYKGKKLLSSFEELYDLVEEDVILLSEEDDAYCKYTNDLFVEDYVDGKIVKTKVLRVIRKPKTNEFRFIKSANGFTQIVTDNHPVITKNGDVNASDIKTDGSDQLTTFSKVEWTGNIDKIYAVEMLMKDLKPEESIVFGGKKDLSQVDLHADKFVYTNTFKSHPQPIKNVIELSKELGYIIGMTLTDGCYANTSSLTVSQNEGLIKEKLLNCCEICNIPYTLTANDIKIGTPDFARVIKTAILTEAKSKQKSLNPEIINFNKDFIVGLISGFVDGDGTVGSSSDMFSIFGNSRVASNKIFYLLKSVGLSPKTSCPRKNDWFRTTVKLTKENDISEFISEKLLKIKGEKTLEELKKSANKRYSYSDDEAFVYENNLFEDDEEFVFDISTETGHFISNGILSHNCYAYDLTYLATHGEFFLKENYNAEPAKHLDTFIDHIIEFIGYMSNRTSGAVGIPNLLVWTYYFWKKDCKENHVMKDPNYYARQEFQKLIYRLNQQFLRVDQSAFTNMSIFDKYYAEALFGGVEFPDGSFFIDDVDGFIEHQKIFMEVVAKTRSHNMFTFPVLTMSILKRDDISDEEAQEMIRTKNWKVFKDPEFARWCSDHNCEWYDSNMFMSDNVGTLSNCCRLLSDTKKLTKEDGSNVYGDTVLSIGNNEENEALLINLLKEFEEQNDMEN